MKPVPLTTEEMREARISFGYCMNDTFEQLLPGERVKVEAWIDSKINPIIPCFALRPDSIQQLTETIFTEVEIRDFCMNLAFRFFSLNGSLKNFTLSLALNLKEGLAIDGPNPGLSVIPGTIVSSMAQSGFSEIRTRALWGWVPFTSKSIPIEAFLASNKHLMVIFMLYLTTTVSPAPLN